MYSQHRWPLGRPSCSEELSVFGCVCVNKLADFSFSNSTTTFLTLSSPPRYFHHPAFRVMLVIDRPVTDGKKKRHRQSGCVLFTNRCHFCLLTAFIRPSQPPSQIKLAVNSRSDQIKFSNIVIL